MNRALRLIRRRLIGSIAVLLIVITGTFLLLEAAPGDAVDAYVVSVGGDASMIEELRRRWGSTNPRQPALPSTSHRWRGSTSGIP